MESWTESSIGSLIDSWGARFLELNRGILRQKDWKDIANAFNESRHPNSPPVTHVRCKNRVDSLKKKYRLERSKLPLPSSWPFYARLDFLVGDKKRAVSGDQDGDRSDGAAGLARALAQLAEIYERTERSRLMMAMELERQRMEFSREIEAQRLNMFLDAQLEMLKSKRHKPGATASGKK